MASILPALASPSLDKRHDCVADQRKGHDDHGGFDGVRTCHASPVCYKAAVLLSLQIVGLLCDLRQGGRCGFTAVHRRTPVRRG